jgi:endoglucanase
MNIRKLLKPVLTVLLLYSGTAFSQSSNNMVKLNQLGFYPEAPKIAISPSAEATTFHIRNAADGTVVYHGEFSGGGAYSFTGETVKVADFTKFKTPGKYVLYADGGGKSYEFEIGNKIFDELSNGLIKALYYNRVSVPLLEEHAGAWARAAGHPDENVIIHPSAATEDRPSGSTISSPGGWYDAGDFNKYVVPISSSINHMLFAYEQFPEYFNNRELNIPESGDTVPDILDEAAFALRWLLTMQDPGDGGVYNKLTHANFQGTIMPAQATASRYVVQKGTAATLDFAAVMAQAARVYRPYMPDFADSALAAAESAWVWAEANPNMEYDQGAMNNAYNPDIGTGGYGDQNFSDEWFWAASELYITTKNDDYYDNGWNGVGVSGWGNVRALGLFSLLHHRQDLTAIGLADTSAMKQALQTGFDWYVNSGNNSVYRSPFGIQSWQFGWGSNGGAGNLGMGLFMLHQTTGQSKYYNSAVHVMDYLLGRNGLAYSYVTGFGEQAPMNIHHRQSEKDNITAPVPGWVAGGPNRGREDGASYSSDLAALSYSDTYPSYASNEITTYWNSPFIYLTAALESSTAEYTHVSNKTISITAPGTDSLYDAGTEVTLEWTATDVSTVDIFYKVFTDEEFTELGTGIDASSGSYAGIEIPDAKGDSVLFRIEDSSNSENWAESAVIKITPGKAITAISIDAPGNYQAGRRLYIGWTTSQIDSVDLMYRFSSESEATLIEEGMEPNEDSYFLFTIPDEPASDTLYIRIQDSEEATIFAESEPIILESAVSNEEDNLTPQEFELKQNYPNPFNPTTNITFSLANATFTKLEVYDTSGRLISTLVEGMKSAGNHTVTFDASQLSSGIYIYKIQSEGFTSTKKMMLIK